MEIRYDFCVFCQKRKSEALKDPRNCNLADHGDLIYDNLYELLTSYKKENMLTHYVHLNVLDEWATAFKKNGAKWHKSCRLKFSISKLNRRNTKNRQSDQQGERSISGFYCHTDNSKDMQTTSKTESLNKILDTVRLLDDEKINRTLFADGSPNQVSYHLRCLSSFYKEASNKQFSSPGLVEVVSFIEEWIQNNDQSKVLYLKDLYNIYTKKVKSYRRNDFMNKNRFKDVISDTFPSLKCEKRGRDVMFYKTADKNQSKLLIMDQLVETIRDNIHNSDNKKKTISQRECVPHLLLIFVIKVLYGVNVQMDDVKYQAALTIAQMFVFNSVKKYRYGNRVRHSHSTPLTDFIATYIYAHTGKKNVIEDLKKLGISIGYQKVLQIYTEKGNDVIDYYNESGIICPPHLPKHQFVTCAVDNIDHNPSSNTSKGSFHGTGNSSFIFSFLFNCDLKTRKYYSNFCQRPFGLGNWTIGKSDFTND